MHPTRFAHHRLDAFHVARRALAAGDAIVRKLPRGYGTLGDQLRRALLVCKDGSAGTLCLSDDGKTCPGNFVSADGTCASVCADDEYAVEYGGPGNGTELTPPLPAGCHGPSEAVEDFAGEMNVCCPCE